MVTSFRSFEVMTPILSEQESEKEKPEHPAVWKHSRAHFDSVTDSAVIKFAGLSVNRGNNEALQNQKFSL